MVEEVIAKHKKAVQDIKLRRNTGELKVSITLQHDPEKLKKEDAIYQMNFNGQSAALNIKKSLKGKTKVHNLTLANNWLGSSPAGK